MAVGVLLLPGVGDQEVARLASEQVPKWQQGAAGQRPADGSAATSVRPVFSASRYASQA